MIMEYIIYVSEMSEEDLNILNSLNIKYYIEDNSIFVCGYDDYDTIIRAKLPHYINGGGKII